jgi:hypothetical protein
MENLDLNFLSLFLQIGGFALLTKITFKIFRKLKLFEIRQESLIHAIKTESKNGFGEAYDKKFKELLSEQDYLK